MEAAGMLALPASALAEQGSHKLAQEDLELLQGEAFRARFRVAGKLGAGAFADVVRVRDASAQRDCALKVLRAGAAHPSGLQPEVALFREARALKHCKHPNVVKMLSVLHIPKLPRSSLLKSGGSSNGSSNGSCWGLLLEYMNEGSLAGLIYKQMVSPQQRIYSDLMALQWAVDVAAGVAHLHGLSPLVIHRDLKLENLLLSKPPAGGDRSLPVAKLSDFGLHVMLERPPCPFMIKCEGGCPVIIFNPQRQQQLDGQVQQSDTQQLLDQPEQQKQQQQKQRLLLTTCSMKRLSLGSDGSQSFTVPLALQPSMAAGAHGAACSQTPAVSFCRASFDSASLPASETAGPGGCAAGPDAACSRPFDFSSRLNSMLLEANTDTEHLVSVPDRPESIRSATPAARRSPSSSCCGTHDGSHHQAHPSGCGCSHSGARGPGSVASSSTAARSVSRPASELGFPSAASMLWDDLMEDAGCQELLDCAHGEVFPSTPLAYDLTAHTGSCMYMAPEVFDSRPYNESVDVFSLGVILYELFSRSLLLYTHTPANNSNDSVRYAARVSKGFRPACPNNFPQGIWAIVQRCWAADPTDRPAAGWVLQQLQQLLDAEAAAAAGGGRTGGRLVSAVMARGRQLARQGSSSVRQAFVPEAAPDNEAPAAARAAAPAAKPAAGQEVQQQLQQQPAASPSDPASDSASSLPHVSIVATPAAGAAASKLATGSSGAHTPCPDAARAEREDVPHKQPVCGCVIC